VTLAPEAPPSGRAAKAWQITFTFPPFARQLWLTRLGGAPSCSLEVFAPWPLWPPRGGSMGEIPPTPIISYILPLAALAAKGGSH